MSRLHITVEYKKSEIIERGREREREEREREKREAKRNTMATKSEHPRYSIQQFLQLSFYF
jgi:hypothetical protein